MESKTMLKESEETVRDYKPGTYLGWLREMLDMIEKHGIWNIVKSAFMLCFVSFFTWIVFNPEMVINKVIQIQEEQHKTEANKRMEANPKVQNVLNEILKETGASRAFVLEMHNGSKNSAGLPFLYVDMSYEEVAKGIERVSEDFQKLSMSRFSLSNVVYDDGMWSGPIENIINFDEKAYYRMKANNDTHIAVILLHGVEDEIGFMGLTFTKDSQDEFDEDEAMRSLSRHSGKVSVLLDGKTSMEEYSAKYKD